jgi:hypothetical protein
VRIFLYSQKILYFRELRIINMTVEEAYKIGFMHKCAELGVDPEVAADSFVKYSALGLNAAAAFLSKTLGLGYNAAEKLLLVGVPVVLGLSGAAGAVIGHHAANATTPPVDLNVIRKNEKRQAYEAGIANLRKTLRRRGVDVDKQPGYFFS